MSFYDVQVAFYLTNPRKREKYIWHRGLLFTFRRPLSLQEGKGDVRWSCRKCYDRGSYSDWMVRLLYLDTAIQPAT